MIKKILIAFVAIIAVFLVVVALQSPDYSISRSAVIDAAPAQVFPQINNFRNWATWSPWAKLDPEMKTTFEGPDSGVGAAYSWSGNMEVGTGKMTVEESQPPERVLLRLDFLKPMKGTSKTEFTCKPEGQGTRVTWTMSGKNNFLSKAICLFMNMDKTMGPYFEKGLTQMKTNVEGQKQDPSPASGG